MISRYRITMFLFAVLFNSIISAQATKNYALRFDGVDDYVRITDTPILSGGADKSITVEAWVYPTGAVADGPVIVKWYDANWKDWGLLLSQNLVQVSIENEGDNWEFNAGEVLPGQWTHIAFTYNAVTKFVTIYVNGRDAGGVYYGKNLPDTNADITIAKRGYGEAFFTGLIDDIRIWNFAKESLQIQQQMIIPLTGTESGLSGYWKLDEGVGDNTKDATKSGQNGALISQENTQGPEWIASTVPFTRLTAINLVAPNGGEILQDSTEVEIKWAADSAIAQIKIDLSTDGGFSWATLTNNTPNGGAFLWRVPALTSESCLLRISDASDNAVYDQSDAAFSIATIAGEMTIFITCQNAYELYVNGKFLGKDSKADSAEIYRAPLFLEDNLFAVKGVSDAPPGGLLIEIQVDSTVVFTTNDSWRQNESEQSGWFQNNYAETNWWQAVSYRPYGSSPADTLIANFPKSSRAFWIWGDTQAIAPVFFRSKFNYKTIFLPDSTSPLISNLTVAGKTDNCATISWQTAEPATAKVLLGTSRSNLKSVYFDASFNNNPVVRLNNLKPNRLYYFQVQATDAAGNLLLSHVSSFVTLSGRIGDDWPDYPANPFAIPVAEAVSTDLFFVEDLNNDGLKDYCFRSDQHVFVYDHFGALLWKYALNSYRNMAEGTRHGAGDIDGDGDIEVLALNKINEVLIFNGSDGKLERTLYIPFVGSGNIWFHLAIVNLRGHGDRDMILQSRDTTGVPGNHYVNRNLIAWDLESNRELWRVLQDDDRANGFYEGYWGVAHGSFQCADVDFDGLDEVVGGNMIDHDGRVIELGYPRNWVGRNPDGFTDHLDAISIGDFRPDLPGLEWVITEEDHAGNTDWHTALMTGNGVLWREETKLFIANAQEPQNVAVGNFDATRSYAEVWARSRFEGPEDSQHPWLIDAFGEEYAHYATDEILPPGFNSHKHGNKEGVEEISVIDWFGGDKKYLAAKARHVHGNIGVFDAMTGEPVWYTPREFPEIRATFIYVADVAGDNCEEVITYDKISRQLKIYWNENASFNPVKPRKWADPLYRRQNQNWNYYSPGGYINEEAADRIAPDFTDLKVTANGGATVSISWKTSERCTGQIQFGLNSQYDSTRFVTTKLVTTHEITLQNLLPDTTYFYRLLITDGSSNVTTSSEYIFITSTATVSMPEISSIRPSAGAVGSVIGIHGKNLKETVRVYFQNAATTKFSRTDSVLTTVVSADAQTGKIRVVTPGGMVESPGIFEILQQPELYITTPNGGEKWLYRSKHLITWESKGKVDSVKIEYSNNNGQSWNLIEGKLANAQSYKWFLPDLKSDSCLIRISDALNGSVVDVSDAPFSIWPTITTVETYQSDIPREFKLYKNYPNPFNPTTTIRFDLPENTHVKLAIYDVLGQQVRILIDDVQPAGAYALQWNGTNSTGSQVGSGVYFYKIVTKKYVRSDKMLFLK